MKHYLVIPAITVVLIGAATVGVMQASAQTTSSNSDSLVHRIATKFGLKDSDVQQVADQYKSDQQAARDQKAADKLTQSVTAGKLTAAQKTLILDKLKQLEADRAANKAKLTTMTPAERKAAMEKERTDLQLWAKDNNIPLSYLLRGFGQRGMGHGKHGNPFQRPKLDNTLFRLKQNSPLEDIGPVGCFIKKQTHSCSF